MEMPAECVATPAENPPAPTGGAKSARHKGRIVTGGPFDAENRARSWLAEHAGMSWKKPEPSEVWRAIEAYLGLAYDGQLPAIVASRLQALRACSEADFYRSSVFELDSGTDPSRYALRLGYRFYPHV